MTNGGSTPEGGRVFTMETICKSEGFWAGSEKVGKLQMTRVVNQERKNNMMQAETRKWETEKLG